MSVCCSTVHRCTRFCVPSRVAWCNRNAHARVPWDNHGWSVVYGWSVIHALHHLGFGCKTSKAKAK